LTEGSQYLSPPGDQNIPISADVIFSISLFVSSSNTYITFVSLYYSTASTLICVRTFHSFVLLTETLFFKLYHLFYLNTIATFANKAASEPPTIPLVAHCALERLLQCVSLHNVLLATA